MKKGLIFFIFIICAACSHQATWRFSDVKLGYNVKMEYESDYFHGYIFLTKNTITTKDGYQPPEESCGSATFGFAKNNTDIVLKRLSLDSLAKVILSLWGGQKQIELKTDNKIFTSDYCVSSLFYFFERKNNYDRVLFLADGLDFIKILLPTNKNTSETILFPPYFLLILITLSVYVIKNKKNEKLKKIASWTFSVFLINLSIGLIIIFIRARVLNEESFYCFNDFLCYILPVIAFLTLFSIPMSKFTNLTIRDKNLINFLGLVTIFVSAIIIVSYFSFSSLVAVVAALIFGVLINLFVWFIKFVTALVGRFLDNIKEMFNSLKKQSSEPKQQKSIIIKSSGISSAITKRLSKETIELTKERDKILSEKSFISKSIRKNEEDAVEIDQIIRRFKGNFSGQELSKSWEYQGLLKIKDVLDGQKDKLSENKKIILHFFNEVIEQLNALEVKIRKSDLEGQAREIISRVAKDLLKRETGVEANYKQIFEGVFSAISKFKDVILTAENIVKSQQIIKQEIGGNFSAVPEGLDVIISLIKENEERRLFLLEEYKNSTEEYLNNVKKEVKETELLLRP